MKEYIFEINDETTVDGCHPSKMKEELIRCKDCKYRLHIDPTEHYPETYICRCDDLLGTRRAYDDEWFCADGKRREE